jgi:hypothetical protein
MKKKSTVGDLINFRGMVYSPVNENGVVFLFGKIVEDLNMYIEEIKPGFPDCIARRFIGKGWERVTIEFELHSKNFLLHKHDYKECDIIVCWEDNWKQIPSEYEIEIIELKSLIQGLPNREVKRPVRGEENKEEHEKEKTFLRPASENIKRLYHKTHQTILDLDDTVWRKFGEKLTSYYSPKRVFTYLGIQKGGILVYIFNNASKINGVTNKRVKWGTFKITNDTDLKNAIPKWKKSLSLIRHAIKSNENTGWYSTIEEEKFSLFPEEDDLVKTSKLIRKKLLPTTRRRK